MSLSALGSNTSDVEVTNISSHGVWLLAHDHELFMPYTDFPWFKTLSAVLNGNAGISPEMAIRLSIAFDTLSERKIFRWGEFGAVKSDGCSGSDRR